ncbi:MAG: DMT family transporter [Lachnospiraceae bacterium]|nr:DMT family transporter [Lachnospiraceae bacterium]
MKNLKYSLLIVLAAFIWGSAFVAQSVGMNYIGPFTFGMARFYIGSLVLVPVIMVFDRKKQSSVDNDVAGDDLTSGISEKSAKIPKDLINISEDSAMISEESVKAKADLSSIPFKNLATRERLILGGILCGTVLCIASSFQQVGIQYTTAGKSGFITSLYVILVPIFGIILHEKATAVMWIGALISLAGMYLLCISETMSVNAGDVLTFFCAVFFAVHIIVVGRFAPFVDGIKLSCIQFFVAGIISTVLAFIFEKPDPSMMLQAAIPILYAGVLSCGVAFTLQTIAQKKVNPVLCSLLFSLESVFSVLTAWLILHDTLSIKEIIGCILVFAAVVLVQVAPAVSKRT